MYFSLLQKYHIDSNKELNLVLWQNLSFTLRLEVEKTWDVDMRYGVLFLYRVYHMLYLVLLIFFFFLLYCCCRGSSSSSSSSVTTNSLPPPPLLCWFSSSSSSSSSSSIGPLPLPPPPLPPHLLLLFLLLLLLCWSSSFINSSTNPLPRPLQGNQQSIEIKWYYFELVSFVLLAGWNFISGRNFKLWPPTNYNILMLIYYLRESLPNFYLHIKYL